MKRLLAHPGYLSDKNGGLRASHLYSNRQSYGFNHIFLRTNLLLAILESLNFRLDDFGLFGKACFTGDLQTVQWVRDCDKANR